jgi:hypothetical protein
MKKMIVNKIGRLFLITLAVSFILASCKKDLDGSPEQTVGDMSSGTVDPGQGAGGFMVTLSGQGIGDIRSVVFDGNNAPAPFLSTLNTESTLIFRIPDTAAVGDQNIVFTNSAGKTLTVPFKVLGLAKITSVSNYNFSTGTILTLTGLNLDDVTSVLLKGTTTEASIVSKTATQLVIEMPATTVNRATLEITNLAGTSTTTQEFISLNNNFVMFTEDWGPGAYNSGVQSWSWGSSAYGSSDFAKSGTKSLRVDYTDGGLSMFLGSDWGSPTPKNFTDFHSPFPTHLSFWARGAGSEVTVLIRPDGGAGPFNATGEQSVTIPSNVWTYFKIPATFITGQFSRLNIQISGGTNKTVYFDDLIWIK